MAGHDTTPAWLGTVGVVVAVAAGVLLTWWTVVAFIGGHLWPLGIPIEGGIGFGLLWLVVIDPIAAGLLWLAGMAVMAPLAGLARLTRRR